MSWKLVVATLLLAIAACAQTPNDGASVSVRHFVAPAYPAVAWLAQIQGTAVAEVTIRDGAVDSVKIISALPVFRESLEKALKQWSFQSSANTSLRVTTRFEIDPDCPLSDSAEPGKLYYLRTNVTADLPSNVDVRTCPRIYTTETSESRPYLRGMLPK